MSSITESGKGIAPTANTYLIALILGLFAFFSFWAYVQKVPLGAPPDEWAHLTYVHEIAEAGRWQPDYSGSVILNSRNGNYLSHPPLYYMVEGFVGRAFGLHAVESYREFRLLSALMVAAGVVLWTLSMMAWGLSRVRAITVVAATLAVPMFPYLAGSINNDNLAYLGVAIFFYGLSTRHHLPRASYYIGAMGVATAILTKATAAVFLVAFICVWVFLRLLAGENLFRNRAFIAAATLLLLVSGAYFVPTLLAYGTPFPKAGTLYSDVVTSVHLMGFFEYASAFFDQMVGRLSIVMSHRSYAPLSGATKTAFYLMLLCPLIGWVVTRPFTARSEFRDLSDAFMAALSLTIFIHLVIGWKGYHETGLMAGIQPRYYSYALPGLFFLPMLGSLRLKISHWMFGCFATLAVICLGVVPISAGRNLAMLDMASASSRPTLKFPRTSGKRDNVGISIVEAQAGYVDRLSIENGQMTATGWAIDASSKHPASSVWVLYDGMFVGSSHPGKERPDVAKAVAAPQARLAGFFVKVEQIPVDIDVCAIKIYAEQAAGTITELRNPSCDGDK